MSLLKEPTQVRLRRAQLISQARRSEAKEAVRELDHRSYKDVAPTELVLALNLYLTNNALR